MQDAQQELLVKVGKIKKYVSLYIYLYHLKNAIFLEPIYFPENKFKQDYWNSVVPDPE